MSQDDLVILTSTPSLHGGVVRDPEYLHDVSEVHTNEASISMSLPKDRVLREVGNEGTKVDVWKHCFGISAL